MTTNPTASLSFHTYPPLRPQTAPSVPLLNGIPESTPVREVIEMLFMHLKECGFLDDLGIYLGPLKSLPDPFPLDELSQEKLSKLLNSDIQIGKSDTIYSLKQITYIRDFNSELTKTFSNQKDLEVKTYLRGGTADHLLNIFSYIQFFIRQHPDKLKHNPKKLIEIIKFIQNHPEVKNPPKDIDWLDSLNIKSPTSDFPEHIKKLFIKTIANHSQGKLTEKQARERAFKNLTRPKSHPFFSKIDALYCSSTIGDTDRATGIFTNRPFLFTLDALRFLVVSNGQIADKITPESSDDDIWRALLDKFFTIVRLVPEHEDDVRSAFVALHHLTGGGYLVENKCTLRSILNRAFLSVDQDDSLRTILHQLILDRFIKHSVNPVSYLINLFLFFQVSTPPNMYPFISTLWSELKKKVLPKELPAENSCPILRVIFEKLHDPKIPYDVFLQSLFQLMLFLKISDIKAPTYKCSTSPIGTPFFRLQLSDYLFLFPAEYGSSISPGLPFIFDKLIQEINPSNLITKAIPPFIAEEFEKQIPELFKSPFLTHHKLHVLFALASKPPFSQPSVNFKNYLSELVIKLADLQDSFDIKNICFQYSENLFSEILLIVQTKFKESYPKVAQYYKVPQQAPRFELNGSTSLEALLSSPLCKNPISQSRAKTIAHFIFEYPQKIEKESDSALLIYIQIKKFLSDDEKVQFFKLILNVPNKTFTKEILKKICECIFEDDLFQNIEVLSAWMKWLIQPTSTDFLPAFLIQKQDRILKTQGDCALLFMDLFIECKINLENTELQNHFLAEFTSYLKTPTPSTEYEQKFLEAIGFNLFPLTFGLFELCMDQLQQIPKSLNQLCCLVKTKEKQTQNAYLNTCLKNSIAKPDRFNPLLKVLQEHSLLSQSILNLLFEKTTLSLWSDHSLNDCINILKDHIEFSHEVQHIMGVLLKRETTRMSFDQIKELSSLTPTSLKSWINQAAQISTEDYLKCLDHLLEKNLCLDDTSENSVFWSKLLQKISWDSKRVQEFFKSFPKLKEILQASSLKLALPAVYENCVKFIPTPPSTNNLETCYFLRTLLKEQQPQDWELLNLLENDVSKISTIIELLHESSDNNLRLVPYVKKIIAFSSKTKGNLISQEKILRLWPDCITVNFIDESNNPEQILGSLLKSSSLIGRRQALHYLLETSDKKKIKNKNALFLQALSNELEAFSDFDLILKIVENLGSSNQAAKPLLEKYQDQLILKVHGSAPFQEKVRGLLCLLNNFKIHSSDEMQTHLLNLIKKGIRLDTENISSWIDLCLQSEDYSRFPLNSEYILVLLQLFTHAKRQKLSQNFSELLKHLKSLLENCEKLERITHLKSAMHDLEELPDHISRVFLWTISLAKDSELPLIEFFTAHYKDHLSKLDFQSLYEIMKEFLKYPLNQDDVKVILPLIASKATTQKDALLAYPFLIDKREPEFALLSQLLPKIESTEKLISLFNALKGYLSHEQKKDEALNLCLKGIWDALAKKKEKNAVVTLASNLDILKRCYEAENEQSSQFFAMYQEARKHLKDSKELDLPIIIKLFDARETQYNSKEDSWVESDFDWLKAFDLNNQNSHVTFIKHFIFFTKEIKIENNNFEKICKLVETHFVKINELGNENVVLTLGHIYLTVEKVQQNRLFDILLKFKNEKVLLLISYLISYSNLEKFSAPASIQLFLRRVLKNGDRGLYLDVKDRLNSEWTLDEDLQKSMRARDFKYQAEDSIKSKKPEDYFATLFAFDLRFFIDEKELWPLLIENLIGYYIAAHNVLKCAVDQLQQVFTYYFDKFLCAQLGVAFNRRKDRGEFYLCFWENRKSLSKNDQAERDKNVLKFVGDLITTFFSKEHLNSDHCLTFLSILEIFLFKCIKEKVNFREHINIMKQMLYGYFSIAKSLDDQYLKDIKTILQYFFRDAISSDLELMLEAELLFPKILTKHGQRVLTINSYQNKLPKKPGIQVILDSIETLSRNKSAVSLHFMINVFTNSHEILEPDHSAWNKAYAKIFKTFKDIGIQDPLFTLCINALNKRFLVKLVPTYIQAERKNFPLHQDLFKKVYNFNKETFNQNDEIKARGFIILMGLLEAGLATKSFTYKEYLQELTFFSDWSLLEIEEELSINRSAFYQRLKELSPKKDDEVSRGELHCKWITTLLQSEKHHDAGLFYFNLSKTDSLISEESAKKLDVALLQYKKK